VGDEKERYRSRRIVAVPEAPIPPYFDRPSVSGYSVMPYMAYTAWRRIGDETTPMADTAAVGL